MRSNYLAHGHTTNTGLGLKPQFLNHESTALTTLQHLLGNSIFGKQHLSKYHNVIYTGSCHLFVSIICIRKISLQKRNFEGFVI